MADEKKPNVFLTWSGERSAAVASALRDWLPEVVQQCRPWMSAADIYAGKRWRGEVRQRLDDIRVGVLCLTPENVTKPWVNFEAGALSRAFTDDDRVIPYCFGFKPTDYSDPLGDFQGVEADETGTLKVVQSINATMPDRLPSDVMLKVFNRAYGDLKKLIDKIPAKVPDAPPQRSTDNYFEEVLTRLRRLEATQHADPVLMRRAATTPLAAAEIRQRRVITALARIQAEKEIVEALSKATPDPRPSPEAIQEEAE
jgi:hypothetical protein